MCPSCKSTNFKKLAIIYSEGLSKGKISIGIFSTRTYKIQQQTELSKIAAPPRKWSYLKPIVLALLFYGLFRKIADAWFGHPLTDVSDGVILSQMLFCGPIVAIVIGTFWHNRRVYMRKLKNWERQFLCQQCGAIFSL